MSNIESLVTVCVLTYNSAEYVLETLESIKNQTYSRIRLIITDDCSSDPTVDICTSWVNENKARFESVDIVTVPQNTGVSANCNRGARAAEGRWFKLIAGDDILCADAIETLVTKAESLEYDKYFIGSFVQPFCGDENLPRELKREQELAAFGTIQDSSRQLELLRIKNCLLAPTVLLPVDVFKRMTFDEKYTFAEDYPMFLNMLASGYRYININRPLVRYRIHSSSISNEGKSEKLFTAYYKRKRVLEEDLQIPYVGLAVRSKLQSDYYVRHIFDRLGLNRKNMLCQVLFSICLRINPFFEIGNRVYKNKLKKYQQTI